jgi:hypothetical protein
MVSNELDTTLIYKESQKLFPLWLLLVLSGGLIPVFIILISSETNINLITGYMLIMLGLLFAASTIRLRFSVDSKMIVIHFFPFLLKPKKIELSNIIELKVRKYSPIKEFGGWGVRFNFLNKAICYNTPGTDYLLDILLSSSKRVQISTINNIDLENFLQSNFKDKFKRTND